jgi:dihydroneopterin aldolase
VKREVPVGESRALILARILLLRVALAQNIATDRGAAADMESTLNIGLAIPQALTPAHTEAALDLIFIEQFTGDTVIGIHESELHRPQRLVIDVHAGVPRARACDTDHIADTIDYGVVCERLRRLLSEHRHRLLEAFAESIAAILIDEFGASWVRVKVVKPQKFDDVAAVGIQIERSAPPTADRPSRAAAVLRLIGSGMVPGGH